MKDAVGTVRSVLVLGGGSELGLAIARRLVGDGARMVALAGRKPERLEPAAEELRRLGAETVELAEFDADAPEVHEESIDSILARTGDLDVAVVAFGVLGRGAEDTGDPMAAVAVGRTNYLGAISAMTVLADRMRRQGHGTIVLLSSVAGERARKSNFVYGASKAGADAFAQGLGDRLAGSGVRVLVVRPGFVRTRMTEGLPAGPFASTPPDVAAAVTEGLRRSAEIVWAPGFLRYVMSAARHLPRPLFRKLEV